MRIKPFRIPVAFVIIAIVSAVLAACGSSDTAVRTPQDLSAPVVAAADTTESDSEETLVSESVPSGFTTGTSATVLAPADTSGGTSEMTVVELTPVDDPATLVAVQSETEPVAESTEAESTEAALLKSYSDYGFALKLDRGADVQTAGWTEPEPSISQGIIAFSYGGVNANLVWGPPQDRTPLTFLAETYNVLRASQTSVAFESISDGDVSISDQAGVYGGFKAVDVGGAAIGGGLIGAWICGDSETAFRMTLTGEDATVVQLRFSRLLENFACSSS